MPTPKKPLYKKIIIIYKKVCFLLSDRNRQFCVFCYSEKMGKKCENSKFVYIAIIWVYSEI